ncbi:hypothetical protein [Cryptosporangium sp. NPDC048952]|uniref:hypothetical protein n=1 Tax=Cryptosporangium sp. NPDC048952 TaxID=3363961 RepID=UPI00371CC36C
MSTRRTQPSPDDEKWMSRAADLARLCKTEPGRTEESPRVAAVAADPSGTLIAEAHRGEDPQHPGDHAEYSLIKKIGPATGRLRGATIYTTLEPCTSRSANKTPCATRLIDEGVAVVYVGMFDPDPRIREVGWQRLTEAGIDVRDFTQDTRERIVELNRPFIDRFQRGCGVSGSATFDYEQNNGEFQITYGESIFPTRWSKSGADSVIAHAAPNSLALARYADIDKIDDPRAYEFTGHFKRPGVGQVVIYRSGDDYCLVRVDDVHSGRGYGHDRTEVTITWEVRDAGPGLAPA